MRILGICDGMTAGACLIEGGRVAFAIHEERLSREKMATGFPRRSINKLFEDTHVKPQEIDAVAVATVDEYFVKEAVGYDGWLRKEQGLLKELMLGLSSGVSRVAGWSPLVRRSYYSAKSLLGRTRRDALVGMLRSDWDLRCPIEFVDHHYAHACSAYFTSGLTRATVLTMDGAGDHASSKVFLAENGRLEKLWQVDSFDSVGNYYAYVTHLCGFKAQKHEGKITGLAAYGKPAYTDILRRFITCDDAGRIINVGNKFYWSAVKALENALPRDFSRADLACSMQQLLEEICCAYVSHWVKRTGCGDLALAGGVFANVKLNQRVHELPGVRSVFVHPGMGDEGLAVGAALALASRWAPRHGDSVVSARLPHVYWGTSYSDVEIERAIDKEGLKAGYERDIEREVARLLAEGHVVGRFNGAMEYGPRALGNRSVLCQPTDQTVNDWLNRRLKRTEFMPFAPVTLEAYADQCYEGLDGARYAANFMTMTFDCTPWMKALCPAVVHVDGTARPQLIGEEANPSYYAILEEYRKLTGLPSLINTSFNMHEEPIVCTPADAIRGFLDSGIDYLAIGNYLIAGQPNPPR